MSETHFSYLVFREYALNSIAVKAAMSSDNAEEATPVPIPNTEVKLLRADGTWTAGSRESRSSLGKRRKTRSLMRSGLLYFLVVFACTKDMGCE